jgi:lipid A disaccharide synthetase
VKKQLSILISSDTIAGQSKLLELSFALKKSFHKQALPTFLAVYGSKLFDSKGIPYLSSIDKKTGIIGIWEGIPYALWQLKLFYPASYILRLRPHLILLSDTSFLNTEVAWFAKKINPQIFVAYYAPPQAETYTYAGDKRAEKVVTNCDAIYTVTMYQEKFYKQIAKDNGIDEDKIVRISFPPVFDLEAIISQRSTESPKMKHKFGFLPGSRPSEWKWSFRLLAQVAESLGNKDLLGVLLPNRRSFENLTIICREERLKALRETATFYVNESVLPDGDAILIDNSTKIHYKTTDMYGFLQNCHRIIATSGTAATEASYMRPTKTIYSISRSNAFLSKFINFEGLCNGESISSRQIYRFYKDRSRNQVKSGYIGEWHFSLVNWLIMRARCDAHGEEAAIAKKLTIDNEYLLFWDDDKRMKKLSSELTKDESWDTSEERQEAIRLLMQKTLLVAKGERFEDPSEKAALDIVHRIEPEILGQREVSKMTDKEDGFREAMSEAQDPRSAS